MKVAEFGANISPVHAIFNLKSTKSLGKRRKENTDFEQNSVFYMILVIASCGIHFS